MLQYIVFAEINAPGRLIFRNNQKFQNPSKLIGFVYSPLWKITVFGGRLFRVGAYFEVGVYFGK